MPLASIQSFWLNEWGPAAASPVSCPVISVGAMGVHAFSTAGTRGSVSLDEVMAAVSSGTRATSTQGTDAEVVC